MRLVLASDSPRRKKILEKAGISFIVRPHNFDETKVSEKNPVLFAREVSEKKAESVERKEDEVILSADTIVSFRGEIIGKPENKKEAEKILKKVSGKWYEVLTGWTLIFDSRKITKASKTRLKVRELKKWEIKNYLENTDEWKDKAGGFAIQGRACSFVERIEGSYYNIVGLPVAEIYKTLLENNIKP